jgi:hypothetical protein
MKIKRFNIITLFNIVKIESDDDGRYVKYEDIKHLIKNTLIPKPPLIRVIGDFDIFRCEKCGSGIKSTFFGKN